MAQSDVPFWESKGLEDMTPEEWESLCDGCGQCCLHKIEDGDTGEILYTYIACRLLDTGRCRCTAYENRLDLVSECLKITPVDFNRMHLLPDSCAYRRLSEEKNLEWWHPLISKNPYTIHQANISVRGKVIPEQNIPPDQFDKYIVSKER
ncbi:MAG: YcgN family cysteine cluster protein [Proteobacteria bacterium]|nr:YcgN family cysteine cluster protein [Pseudomonadota bacterium]